MTTPLIPEVLVVDALDGELEHLLSTCGIRTTRATAAELAALAQPGAQQPDVVLVDTRRVRAIPSSMAVVKRQHPAIGFIVVASESDPAFLLEAIMTFFLAWAVGSVVRGGSTMTPASGAVIGGTLFMCIIIGGYWLAG